jgi:hypothetical protein
VTVTSQLMSATDLDYYSLNASGAGTIAFDFSFPDCNAICWKASLYNVGGTLLAEKTSANNAVSTFTLQNSVSAAGTYYVLVQKGATYSNLDYTVKGRFSAGVVTAESELNETSGAATASATYATLTGQLMSSTDVDYYSFNFSFAGIIAVDFTAPTCGNATCWKASLYDASGNLLAQRLSATNAATSFTLQNSIAAPGTYYVRVEKNITYSGLDYTVTVNWTPGVMNTLESEMNNTSGTANTLIMNKTLTGQLSSAADLDFYTFSATGAGTISFDFTAPSCGNYTCWKASLYDANGNLLVQRISTTNAATTLTLQNWVPAAGPYYVRVEPNTTFSDYEYTITSSFSGAMLAEAEANETQGAATTLTNNVATAGQLMSASDVDYYSLATSAAGTVSFSVTVPTCGASTFCWMVSLRDSSGNVLALKKPTGATTVTLKNIVTSAGTYYLRVEKSTIYSALEYTVTGSINGDSFGSESESNGSRPSATALAANVTTTGQLNDVTDIDTYSVAATAAGTVAFNVSFPNCGAYNCWKASLVDSSGTTLVQKTSTQSAPTTVTLQTLAAAAGTYYAVIEANGTWSDADYTVRGDFNAWSGSAQAFTTRGGVSTVRSGSASLDLNIVHLLSVLNAGIFGDRAATTGDDFYVAGTIGTTWSFSWNVPAIDTIYIRALRVNTTNPTWSVSGDISGGAYTTSSTTTEYAFSTSATTGSATITIGNASSGLIIQDIAFYSGGNLVPVTWMSSPVGSETETNDTVAEATPVSSGTPYSGTVSSTADNDYYAITATSAGTISVELLVPSCGSYYCWMVGIYGTDGTTLLAANSAGYSGADVPAMAVTVPAAGTYYVRIHSGSQPPWYNGGRYILTTTFTPDISTYEAEPNNSVALANAISSGIPVTGQLSDFSATDYYALTVASAGTISVDLIVPTCGSTGNCWSANIYASDGTTLLAKSSAGQSGADIVGLGVAVPAAGTYYVRISAISSTYHDPEQYKLTATFTANASNYEAESNDSVGSATAISSGTPILGLNLSSSESDYYALTVASAGTISVDLIVPNCSGNSNCWRVSIYASDGTTLLANGSAGRNGAALTGLGVTVPAADTYYVLVNGVSPSYWSTAQYKLTATFTANASNYEAEPGNSAAQALGISSGLPFLGQISNVSDIDYFAITATSAGTISVNVTTVSCGSNSQCWIAGLNDTDGTTLLASDNSGHQTDSTAAFTVTVPAAGVYYVYVNGYNSSWWDSRQYTLNATFRSASP